MRLQAGTLARASRYLGVRTRRIGVLGLRDDLRSFDGVGIDFGRRSLLLLSDQVVPVCPLVISIPRLEKGKTDPLTQIVNLSRSEEHTSELQSQ